MERDFKGESTTASQGVDVEGTIQALQQGLRSSETNTAISYIERWMQRLHDTGRPDLHDIADGLSVLRQLLMTGDLDRVAIGETLERLGRKTQQVALLAPEQERSKLDQLGQTLMGAGRQLHGMPDRHQ
ncbi:MAG TPA: hypothetical protein VFU22_00170 [Roseiflexaceae bacterium]|nr:hypothetical protein [Roseiflexaceae bacterium]